MSRRSWALFAAVAVLWGIPYFFIKVAVGEVSPPVVSETRLAIGAAVLLPVAALRSAIVPALRRWPWLLALAVGYLALALTLIPVAETYVTSSLTAILIAAVPIAVALVSLRWTRPSAAQLVGLALGLAGVATLVGLDVGLQSRQIWGVAALAVVVLAYALGPIMTSRKLGGLDPLGYMSVSMLVAAVILLPAAVAFRPAHLPSEPVLLALAALGVLCTAIPYALYFTLVAEAGPMRATLVAYINPAVAVLLGVIFLKEPLTWAIAAGMPMVLGGSWLATGDRLRRAAVRRGAEQPSAAGGGGA